MTTRIGIGVGAPTDGAAAPPAPPPRGVRLNGAARRLAPEVPEEGPSSAGNSPPRPILLAAGALAILSIALAAGARLTGRGHMAIPPGQVEVVRDLRFADSPNGSVVVHARPASGGAERQVAVLAPGELMFVRSTVRALARGRRLNGSDAQTPFRVTRYRDGRMTLDDLATKEHLELSAFGPTNAAAFEQLLNAARD